MKALHLCLATLLATTAFAQTAPPAPTLTAGPDFKGLQFDWDAVAGASWYELEYKPNQQAAFVQLGSDLPASATTFRYRFPLHLFDWTFARYRLAACNSAGCTRSDAISVSSLRRFAVGYFKPSDTVPNMRFGTDTDISPDGLNFVSAAPGTPPASAGAIYVFRRAANGTWTQRARLLPTTPHSINDSYLVDVAISADGNTVVLGVPGYLHAEGDQQSGEVFVFRFNGTSWVRSRLYAGVRGVFGRWIDLNDAGDTIAVASGYSFTPANPRRVFIYKLTNGAWDPVRGIGDTYPESCFSGVLSGDGSTVAETCVGPGGSNGLTYVRTHSGPNWTVRADLPLEMSVPSDWGYDHGGLGIDFAGDTIAAKVSVNSGRDPDVGPSEVHVFKRTTGVYSRAAVLSPGAWRNPEQRSFYGNDVAVSGNGGTVVVGDVLDNGLGLGPRAVPLNPGTAQTGAVYVYRLSGTWRLANIIKRNYERSGGFGDELALNGNGQTLLIGEAGEFSSATGIGGNWSNANANASGAVWMY
jgi:trimeric autotransporter adhesin